ncbi:hypothetical protein [Parvicella tangerina]|nr:hypothetical protein [Parvicella tangerina]
MIKLKDLRVKIIDHVDSLNYDVENYGDDQGGVKTLGYFGLFIYL